MDLDLLQGAWRAVRIVHGGSEVPDEVAMTVRYIFDGDQVLLMEGDQRAGEGVIRLDPSADPGAFDFTATKGAPKGTTAMGIYRIEGDLLTMCMGDERPTDFTGEGKAALVELVRIA